MTRYNPVGRLDDIIMQLEQLYEDAQDIFDAHVDAVMARNPKAISFGVTKWNEIAIPAGSALNYMAALKMLREKYAWRAARRPADEDDVNNRFHPARIPLIGPNHRPRSLTN